jgi:hypothetical protein
MGGNAIIRGTNLGVALIGPEMPAALVNPLNLIRLVPA